MSPDRGALSSLSLNQPLDQPSPSSSGLYPIFQPISVKGDVGSTTIKARRITRPSPQGTGRAKPDAKRARVSLGHSSSVTCDVTRESIAHYFAPRTPLRQGIAGPSWAKEAAPTPIKSLPNVWRRHRRRLGQSSGFELATRLSRRTFLSSLVTRTSDDPRLPPCNIALPSVNSAVGDREHDPALVVAFNNAAKLLTAEDAQSSGKRRLMAIGGEEGAIRILDVDQPLESDAPDHWWSAHNNGIFDLKWTGDDERLVSASADQTIRVHDVNGGRPQLLATLVGHTSTIKSVTNLDTSRTNDTPYHSNVIVSGGRDGNIHLYDLRCRGSATRTHDGPSGRTRRNQAPQIGADGAGIGPVVTLRQPHNVATGRRASSELRSVSRTITSLVSLQSMPGVLASGGSFDGVVKLWDVRVPAATGSLRPKASPLGDLPDPTICGPNPSRRPRSVNALCEDPRTGDLYALCGDSQIHALRPSAVHVGDPLEAILPYKYAHPDLLTRSFYIRMSLSSDGRYLACGSSHAGVMTWDTEHSKRTPLIYASRLAIPPASSASNPEVIAVDWGRDMLSASSDDGFTRIWRSQHGAAE